MIKSILQKLGLRKPEEEPEIVSISVSEGVIREKVKEPRDFTLRVTATGEVTGHCKDCDGDIFLARDRMLIWFHCKSCNRYSFTPPGNVARDAHFAEEDGHAFESEGFFIDFPPQLQPPAVFDSTLLKTSE